MTVYFGEGIYEIKDENLYYIDGYSVVTIAPKWTDRIYKGVIDEYGNPVISFFSGIEHIENLGKGNFIIHYNILMEEVINGKIVIKRLIYKEEYSINNRILSK